MTTKQPTEPKRGDRVLLQDGRVFAFESLEEMREWEANERRLELAKPVPYLPYDCGSGL